MRAPARLQDSLTCRKVQTCMFRRTCHVHVHASFRHSLAECARPAKKARRSVVEASAEAIGDTTKMKTRVRPVKVEVKPELAVKKEISVKAEETPIKPEPSSIKSEAALIKLEPSTAAASKTATATKKRARPATAEGPSAKRTLPQARPTEQECRAVHRALATLHPEVMERVRTERNGERGPGGGSCGRRACVLDSLVGTILSQNTTDTNSHRAFSRLKEALPSWEEVRLRAPYPYPSPSPSPSPNPNPRPSPNLNPNPNPKLNPNPNLGP